MKTGTVPSNEPTTLNHLKGICEVIREFGVERLPYPVYDTYWSIVCMIEHIENLRLLEIEPTFTDNGGVCLDSECEDVDQFFRTASNILGWSLWDCLVTYQYDPMALGIKDPGKIAGILLDLASFKLQLQDELHVYYYARKGEE